MTLMRSMLVMLMALIYSLPATALEIQPVTEGVWALVGEMRQRRPENFANNATFGIVETAEGAVLIDPGGSHKGAMEIHDAIRQVTDVPVMFVIDTGGQDHRWLGNAYWQGLGAKVIASEKARDDQRARVDMQMAGLGMFLGDTLAGTEPRYADITFADTYEFEIGGLHFTVTQAEHAHTPGDSFVWVPEKKTVFTGDIVFTERLLGVLEYSSIKGWPLAFEAVAALAPEHLVPGHGHATTLAKARADTYDYLVNLRTRMASYIEGGGDIIGSVEIDQSAFAYLDQFESLARRNAQTAFQQMEWE